MVECDAVFEVPYYLVSAYGIVIHWQYISYVIHISTKTGLVIQKMPDFKYDKWNQLYNSYFKIKMNTVN